MSKQKQENFEQAMEELEKIVLELENGNLSLDESVKKFENGMEISKKCNEILQNAEKKITILIEKDDILDEKPFDVEE